MPRLTARGVVFLLVGALVGALAYLLERPELLPIAAIAIAAPLIALATVATSRPRVTVTRQLDPVVATVGETVRVAVSVSGRARAAEWLERVPMPPGFAGPGRLRDVRITRPAIIGYRFWPDRRGLVAVGPLLIEDRDPFALAVRVSDTIAVTTQLVIPAVDALAPGPVPDPATDTGPRTSRSRERADDDVVTREYRDGDALRRVHWRVTARQGELMVRQDEPQAGPHSRLVIDTHEAGYRDAAATSATFEWVVRMAASVAVHLAERGYTVGLVTPTDRVPDAPRADGPVGDVLGELALLGLGPRDELAAVTPPRGVVPLVAIASAPDLETVRWILSQRSSAAPAVALLVGDPGLAQRSELGAVAALDPARDAFERAGWAVARVSTRLSPEQAWLALLGDSAEADGLPEWAVARG